MKSPTSASTLRRSDKVEAHRQPCLGVGTLPVDARRPAIHAPSPSGQPRPWWAVARAKLTRMVQTTHPGGMIALGFQHRGGPVESIVTVAENPRSASVAPDLTGPPLIRCTADGRRGMARNETPQ